MLDVCVTAAGAWMIMMDNLCFVVRGISEFCHCARALATARLVVVGCWTRSSHTPCAGFWRFGSVVCVYVCDSGFD